jgi:hypothetical protein
MHRQNSYTTTFKRFIKRLIQTTTPNLAQNIIQVFTTLLFLTILLTPDITHAQTADTFTIEKVYFKDTPVVQYKPNRIYIVIDSTIDFAGKLTVSYIENDQTQYLFKDTPMLVIGNSNEGFFVDKTFNTSGDINLTIEIKDSDSVAVESKLTSKVTVAGDNDGDGIPDSIDPDDDNDGLSDVYERSIGTDPFNTDTDNDGVIDSKDKYPLDNTKSSDASKAIGDAPNNQNNTTNSNTANSKTTSDSNTTGNSSTTTGTNTTDTNTTKTTSTSSDSQPNDSTNPQPTNLEKEEVKGTNTSTDTANNTSSNTSSQSQQNIFQRIYDFIANKTAPEDNPQTQNSQQQLEITNNNTSSNVIDINSTKPKSNSMYYIVATVLLGIVIIFLVLNRKNLLKTIQSFKSPKNRSH